MIPTYLVDGHRVTAMTSAELVTKMHNAALFQAADDKAYMLDVAERTRLQDGGVIRTDTAMNFVFDLLEHGFIKLAPPPFDGEDK